MDKFLFSQVQGHKNVPVPLSLIHSFKRMRHFTPYSAVVDALKDSNLLTIVDGDKVQRKVPLPKETQGKEHAQVQRVYEDAAMARSIYAKGFGEEKPTTQFDLEAFFTPYGPYNSVRLRRDKEKLFKGSVFVEFETEEIAKAFLDLDPKPTWNDQELLIKSKKQYCDDKADDIDAGRIAANSNWKQHSGSKQQHHETSKNWNVRRSEDQKSGSRNNRGDRGGGRGRGNNRGGRHRNEERQRQERLQYVRLVHPINKSLTLCLAKSPRSLHRVTSRSRRPSPGKSKKERKETVSGLKS